MNMIKKAWGYKAGGKPIGKFVFLAGALLIFGVVQSQLRPDETEAAAGVNPEEAESMLEKAFSLGRDAEAEYQEGVTDGKNEVAEQVFGTTLDSALLAELTELDNLYAASGDMLQGGLGCRAERWYERAEELQETDGINPTHFLDGELKARQGQLRELQTSYGDIRMNAEQFDKALPLMAEIQAISWALRKFKEDWLAVTAQGEPRPPVPLACSANVFQAEGAIADYLFQVGARREVEQSEQAESDRLLESVPEEVARDEQ